MQLSRSSHHDFLTATEFSYSVLYGPTVFSTVNQNDYSGLRRNNSVSHPPWENEWALFREQLELEMKQMKEMYLDVQEIRQDLKRMGSHREDTSGHVRRRQSLSEAVSNRVDDGVPELGQSKKHGALNFAHTRENGHHQPNQRPKSAPRTRVNWDSDLPEEDSEHARAPTAALFKEVIKEKRLYLRKFVAALITYEENRFLADDFEFEQNSNSLREMVTRLLPRANFANDWHFKYGIEAWLSRVIFKELEMAEGTVSEINFALIFWNVKLCTHYCLRINLQRCLANL